MEVMAQAINQLQQQIIDMRSTHERAETELRAMSQSWQALLNPMFTPEFYTGEKKDRHQAYQLTSLAGDVAITQLVDGTMGVHVKMPKSIFK